jgi:hypothetical protein
MAIPVRSKEFSSGSPLDYAQLNDMVKDIIQLANSITVIDVGTGTGTGTGTGADTSVKNVSTVHCGMFSLADVPVLSKTKFGQEYKITFLDENKAQVTFISPPRVVCIARTGNAGSGLVILNQVGDATTTGFIVRAGWVNRTTSGNANVEYIAVGVKKA